MEHATSLLQKQHEKYRNHGKNRKRGGNYLSISPSDDGRIFTVSHNPNPDYPLLVETADFTDIGKPIEQVRVYIDKFAVSGIDTLDDIIATTLSIIPKGEHPESLLEQLTAVETTMGYSPLSDTLVTDSKPEVEASKITYGTDTSGNQPFATVTNYMGGKLLVFRFNYIADEYDSTTEIYQIGFYSGIPNNQTTAVEGIINTLKSDNHLSPEALRTKVAWFASTFDIG